MDHWSADVTRAKSMALNNDGVGDGGGDGDSDGDGDDDGLK